MNFRCALFGHKYKPFVDDFEVDLKAGPKLQVEMKTCERCGKKFFRVCGTCDFKSKDKKSTATVKFTYQPKLKGDWDVRDANN